MGTVNKHYTYIVENKQTKLLFVNCMIGAMVVCLSYVALAKEPEVQIVDNIKYKYIDTSTCPKYDPHCLIVKYYNKVELTPNPK